jgi:hypothetical protein
MIVFYFQYVYLKHAVEILTVEDSHSLVVQLYCRSGGCVIVREFVMQPWLAGHHHGCTPNKQ